MNEERRYTIAKLAQAESRARREYESLGLVNVNSQDFEARERLDRDYAIAKAAWLAALSELRDEVERDIAVRGGNYLAGLPNQNAFRR